MAVYSRLFSKCFPFPIRHHQLFPLGLNKWPKAFALLIWKKGSAQKRPETQIGGELNKAEVDIILY